MWHLCPELTRENQLLLIMDLQNWLKCGPGFIDLFALMYATFTTHYLALRGSPPVPANAQTCISDMICSVIDAGTMTVRTAGPDIYLFYINIFCVGMNQKCVPLGHWNHLLLDHFKQIADLMVNFADFPETVSVVYLPVFIFVISLDPTDVHNAGKVTLCCGSESISGHYSLSAAHHHWSHKGLNTYTDQLYNMLPLYAQWKNHWQYEKLTAYVLLKNSLKFKLSLISLIPCSKKKQ